MCYVVVDLEMCIIPKTRRNKKYRWAHEIIQIGAVLLDKAYDVKDSFNMLVKPEYGVIDGNIELLTGIRREMVKDAPDIRSALKAFADWIPSDAEFVTWSENDEMQIKREIEGKDISFAGIEKFSGNWIDCQETFSQIIMDTRKYKLEEALNLSDVDYDIHLHDGLVDASNTALLFRKMRTEKDYKFNTYYIDSKKEPEMLTSTLGELFGNIKLAATDDDTNNAS